MVEATQLTIIIKDVKEGKLCTTLSSKSYPKLEGRDIIYVIAPVIGNIIDTESIDPDNIIELKVEVKCNKVQSKSKA